MMDMELVYAGAEIRQKVEERFPHATVRDASDMVHEHRFEVQGVEEGAFRQFAFDEGFAGACLGIRLDATMHPEKLEHYLPDAHPTEEDT